MRIARREAWRLLFRPHGGSPGTSDSEPASEHANSETRGLGRAVPAVTYYLVPSGGEPRILIDGRSWRWADQLFRPTRASKRLFWTLLVGAGRWGLASRVLEHVTVPPGYSASLLEELLGLPIDGLSILLGTEGVEQKLVAQVVSASKVVAYVKVADDEAGRWLLGNESRMLASDSLRALGIAPELLAHAERGPTTYLCSGAISGTAAGRQLTEAHRACLLSMRGPELVALSDTDVSARVSAAAVLTPEIADLWKRTQDSAVGVPFRESLVHGDFAPWNARKVGTRLVMIDWEYGVERGISGLDLLHHHANTRLLLDGIAPSDLATELLENNQAAELAFGSAHPPEPRWMTSLVATTMLFDVATGCVATGGVVSETNRLKLEIVCEVLAA